MAYDRELLNLEYFKNGHRKVKSGRLYVRVFRVSVSEKKKPNWGGQTRHAQKQRGRQLSCPISHGTAPWSGRSTQSFFWPYLTQQLLTSAQTSRLLIHLTSFCWLLSISLLPVWGSSSQFESYNKAFLRWPHPALSSLSLPDVMSCFLRKWLAATLSGPSSGNGRLCQVYLITILFLSRRT